VKIAKPLTDLLQKGREFAWSEHCEKAVRRLIGLVTSEPVIVPPDTDQQFILYVYASQFATGAILYQADKEQKDARGNPLLRPLGFNSQTFNKTEQNYPIYDRELVTAKVEVPRGCAMLVVKRIVTAWERQLDCLWRQGLRLRALADLEGDSIQ